jgi:5'-3' exonuclease
MNFSILPNSLYFFSFFGPLVFTDVPLQCSFYQVKLGEPGWKERYYEQKFSAKTLEEMEDIQRDVVSTCTTVALIFLCLRCFYETCKLILYL